MSDTYTNLSAEEALQAIARIFDEGTDEDGWDIGILEEVYRVLVERGLAIDTDDEAVPNTGMSQSAMLRHHLEYNHFPPLDFETWAPVAQAAIDAAERGVLDETLQTPAGFHSVQAVMDNLHLWDFVTTYDEDAVMKVRISYIVDVSDEVRRQINEWYGRPGLANRDEVKSWYQSNGFSMDDDLNDMADRSES